MDKKTWVTPSVTPLAAAKDAELLRGTVGDLALGKQTVSGS